MSSFDQTLREMIRQELRNVIQPLAAAVTELQQHGNLTSQLTKLINGGATAKRGPGRPRKLAGSGVIGRKPGKRGRKAKAGTACAVIGCKRPMRSKGYCSSHYQKRRMLVETKRLPSDWVEGAKPATVKDLVLPRGRAGAKALAESKKK